MIHRRLIAKGIKYYLTFPHANGHGIKSPYLYQLIQSALQTPLSPEHQRIVNHYRQTLADHKGYVDVQDLGAGEQNQIPGIKRKSIAEMVKKEAISPHYGKFLLNLTSALKPDRMLELGTSLGMGSLYMALGNPAGKLTTLEGVPQKAVLASSLLLTQLKNIEVRKGNFDQELPGLLKNLGIVDFAFIDGNHKKANTLQYFDQIAGFCHPKSVLVFDDINWSPGMISAWEAIQRHPRSRVCLDFFRMGLVFLDPLLEKQNITIFY